MGSNKVHSPSSCSGVDFSDICTWVVIFYFYHLRLYRYTCNIWIQFSKEIIEGIIFGCLWSELWSVESTLFWHNYSIFDNLSVNVDSWITLNIILLVLSIHFWMCPLLPLPGWKSWTSSCTLTRHIVACWTLLCVWTRADCSARFSILQQNLKQKKVFVCVCVCFSICWHVLLSPRVWGTSEVINYRSLSAQSNSCIS